MGNLIHHPADEVELIGLIAEAAERGHKLELRGGGSKREVGVATDAAVVELGSFSGVIDYDPAELVLTAGAATPLTHIEAALSAHGQALAFEPFDHGPIFGRPVGAATLGGVIAAGVSGSRRLSRGAARDHLLGFRAVSGRGEALVGGSKVVKNVTGFDLPKVMTGSWGCLAALTEVTLKVLPRAPDTLTLAIAGLSADAAIAVMSKAMGSKADPAAAAHSPLDGGLTALRLEGLGPSIRVREQLLTDLLNEVVVRPLSADGAVALWDEFRTLKPLDDGRPLWRLVVPARAAAEVIATFEPLGARWLMDWAGGLIWLTVDAAPTQVRAVAEGLGGHAALVRADEALRRSTPTFHPQSPGVEALETRVRRAFDPAGVFETGRFGKCNHAD
jgi:glycolate oxidase FAD binding subunit